MRLWTADQGRLCLAAFLRATATGLVAVLLGLYLARLRVGPAAFGLVVAAGGVRIAEGASLEVAGALWLGGPGGPGVPGAPASPMAVAGRLALRQRQAAILAADGLLALPRRALLRGLRDVG